MLSVLDSSSNINDNNSDNNSNIQQQPNHNVLDVVNEFLLGSKAELKTLGGPSIQDVWRLRAAVVTSTQQKMGQQEQRSRRGVLHPAQVLPYVDNASNRNRSSSRNNSRRIRFILLGPCGPFSTNVRLIFKIRSSTSFSVSIAPSTPTVADPPLAAHSATDSSIV
mmetsp:Transcript_36898/g.37359  ORF Transcript_36898/g.37359 Transcript_36898/m.37359 type:complete len:165 (-) Transcript_36898:815-1309(-)